VKLAAGRGAARDLSARRDAPLRSMPLWSILVDYENVKTRKSSIAVYTQDKKCVSVEKGTLEGEIGKMAASSIAVEAPRKLSRSCAN
jgi:hypothetical protein